MNKKALLVSIMCVGSLMASGDGILLDKVQERDVGEIENTVHDAGTLVEINHDKCCQHECTSENVQNKMKIDIGFDPALIEKCYYNLDDFKENTINKICKDEVYPNIECEINEERNCITIVCACNEQELDKLADKIRTVIQDTNSNREQDRVNICVELGLDNDMNNITWTGLNEWLIWEKLNDAIALHHIHHDDSQIVSCVKRCVAFYADNGNVKKLCRADRLYIFMQLCIESPKQMIECKKEVNLVMSKLLCQNYDCGTNMYRTGKKIYEWLYDNVPEILGEYYVC